MTKETLLHESQKDREAWRAAPLACLKSIEPSPANPAALLPSAFALPPALFPRLVLVNGAPRPDLSTCAPSLLAPSSPKAPLPLDADLELLFLTLPSDKPQESETSLHFTLPEGSALRLLERHLALQGAFALTEFSLSLELAPNARLDHLSLAALPSHLAHFGETRVRLAEAATYEATTYLAGEASLRQALQVEMQGRAATATLKGLLKLEGASQADLTARLEHLAPEGRSEQCIKAVLSERAHGAFQGTVLVAPNAQKTDAKQNTRALLLSSQAEMDAKPELEIYADDVQCSHGAAIGALDEEAMFYLASRGIPAQEAQKILVEAFLEDLVASVSSEPLREALRTELALSKEPKP